MITRTFDLPLYSLATENVNLIVHLSFVSGVCHEVYISIINHILFQIYLVTWYIGLILGFCPSRAGEEGRGGINMCQVQRDVFLYLGGVG